MLCGAVTIAIVISVTVLFPGSTYTKSARHNLTYELHYNVTTRATEIIIQNEDVTQVLDKEPGSLYNVTDNMLGRDRNDRTTWSDDADKLNDTTIEPLTLSDGYSDPYLYGNMSQFSDMHQNNISSQENMTTSNDNDTFTNETSTTQETNTHESKTLFPGKVQDQSKHNIPYHTSNGDDLVRTLMLERKKIHLQHHLQLVPMEDKPLDAMMIKNQRYIISVLIPIGVGMIGAAMIVCTVLTLRKVARKRAVTSPLDDGAEVERPNTPCISSISTETTDKVFLLLGDDDI
ncbi:uncharacterized protein LOC123545658 [Mercenaria mercenaria]|uniref:uncharacterized protein LOC123545658 n=1 Tax=Mercenaria mercenaria TaxID=6596 RepID=UPI00234F22CC|nr:uncharacterized protein LOC123545658 [Mercenaria mercenaria]XP_045187907.2 uncharacterized protein LOC123545658 [Mercenaria mercenaria]